MDFIDQLRQLSDRILKIKEQVTTEEATKTSMIMPFFQILGYDVFNPDEFVPEFTADVGVKKGEKVDYAILSCGHPVILIEAKWCGDNLQKHDSQLYRYFSVTQANFAILTNGILYKFYTDLEQPNKMDEVPFLEFNILDIKEPAVSELKKFQKINFDVDTILNTAEGLKYSTQIKQYFQEQLNNPADNFVKFFAGKVYSGRITQAVIDRFKDIVKQSLNQYINELMTDKIKNVIEIPSESSPIQNKIISQPSAPPNKNTPTEEETEAFYIVKTILRKRVEPSRITHKCTDNHFSVLIDNNARKWICRLVLGDNQKYMLLPGNDKKTERVEFRNIDSLYAYRSQLTEALDRYLCI